MPDLPRCQTQEARTRSLFDQEGNVSPGRTSSTSLSPVKLPRTQRSTTYKGLNGETSFITITDHFTDSSTVLPKVF
jgi:hypothetical protein